MLVLVITAGLGCCARPGVRPASQGVDAVPRRFLFEEPDARALSAPPGASVSIESLARYLTDGFDAEETRARSIFRWVAANIHYNVDSRGAVRHGASSADDVLRSRSAVCGGYADLFTALARSAGLETEVVSGYAKGIGHRAGDAFSGPSDHAWNVVRVNGEWRLVDCTWAAGTMDLDRGYVERFEPFYFSPTPRELLYTHFPEDPRWQLVEAPISLSDFERLPYLKPPFFRYGLEAVNQESCVIEAIELTASLTLKTLPGVHIMGRLVKGSSLGSDQEISVQKLGGVSVVRARLPAAGAYWLHVFAADSANDERRFRRYEWAAEYKIGGR